MAVAAKAKAPAARAPAPKAEPVPPPPMEHNKPPQEMRIAVPSGRAIAYGRDGKPIWRQGIGGGVADMYAIDPAIIPDNWIYEWKRYSVMGQVDHAYQAKIRREGKWSPVMAESHPGVWLPLEATGDIIVDGLILMERPLALHQEAKRDEENRANGVMRNARSMRGLAVPSGAVGVSTDTPDAQRASYINTTRAFQSKEDRDALDSVPKPAYRYDHDAID